MLNKERVTLCVDTNVLVELKPLEKIPWRQLAPNAEAIHIVVVTKVAEEMDEHKRKTGRLRRRALEFVQLARRIEESADGCAVLRESSPLITIEFAPIYRRADLGDLYDLNDDDGRIVAEVARFKQDHPDAALLADDWKPRRLARQTGLPCERPPDSWRREEGPDERDKEIADLKRELGARPYFSISFLKSCPNNTYYLNAAPKSCSVCATELAAAIVGANSKTSRTKLIERHGLERRGPFGMEVPFPGGLTSAQLAAYDKEYQEFEDHVSRWALAQSRIFSTLGYIMPIRVEVTNSGDRAGEKVLIDLKLQGEFHFASCTFVHHMTGERLAPPDPPKPRTIHDGVRMPDLSKIEQPRPHEFYLLDKPKVDGSTTHLEWRCEEFRHGSRFVCPLIVRATRCSARGALNVCVSSTAVAKVTKAQAPLVCLHPESGDARLCAYLQARIALFPPRFQEPVRHAIVAAREACGRKNPECQDETPRDA